MNVIQDESESTLEDVMPVPVAAESFHQHQPQNLQNSFTEKDKLSQVESGNFKD